MNGSCTKGGSAAAQSFSFDGDPNTGIYSAGADQLAISTGGTGRLFVSSAGNVGIGTSSPGSKLDVTGGNINVNGGSINVITSSGTAASLVFNVSGIGAAEIAQPASENALTFKVWNGFALVERSRLDSSGRLLVGTSSSGGRIGATFQIAASGAGYLFEQRYAESNASGADLFLTKSRGSIASPAIVNSGDNISIIRFSGYDGASYLETATIASAVDGTPGTNDMPGRLVFSTTADGAASPTERMRITSGGFVGIGASTPLYTLESASSDDIQISLTRNAVGRWLLGTTSANNLKFAKEGGAEAMRFDASSRVLVGITSANTSGAKLQTYDGLTFPATQVASSDPNTLDDYEEGTFTPTVIGLTTAGTGTYSTQIGKYTKIGRLVTVEVYMDWSAHTGSGNMAFSGLPFTIPAGTGSPGASLGFVSNINFTAGYYLTAYAAASSTAVILQQNLVGGGASGAVPVDTVGSVTYSLTYAV